MASKNRITILYIPGLGDQYDWFRLASLKCWRIWGVHTQLVPMKWYGGGSFESSWDSIKKAVDSAKANGDKVFVIGESAGATMAIHTAAHLPIDAFATLCGVTNPNASISSSIFARSPSFKQSVQKLQSSLDILKDKPVPALRFIAWLDTVVTPSVNTLSGARTIRLPSIGHIITNKFALTIFSFLVVRAARRSIK